MVDRSAPVGMRLTTLMIGKELPDSAVPMSLRADHPNVRFNCEAVHSSLPQRAGRTTKDTKSTKGFANELRVLSTSGACFVFFVVLQCTA